MRIALVSQEYPPETAKGGIGSQTYIKAHGLAALGHDVEVISRATNHQLTQKHDDGVRVTRVPGFEHRADIHTEAADWLTYSAEVAAQISAIHKEKPLEVIEFPEWGAEGYVHLLNRTEWNHIPTAIHLHGPLVMFAHTMGWPKLGSSHYCVGSTMEGTCLKLADAIFSSSKCSIQWCAQHHGIDPQRIPVLHTGVDTQHFSPRDIPRDARPTILFVGKIAENKGVRLLVQSASQLAREIPDLQLRLIGRGPEPLIKDLRQTATRLNAPDLLDFRGFVDREQLPDELSRAHLFAAPSIYEGGPGFVYLEAMACGLPVIGCEGSGAAEVITDQGLLIPPGDAHALSESLRRLLTDTSLHQSLSRKGLTYVQTHADSNRCVRNLEAFYKAVAAGEDWNPADAMEVA